MILESNGSLFEIMLEELSVRLNLKLDSQDASGKTSSTAELNNGTKPKKLIVNGTLRESDAEYLTELIRLAESVDDDGKRTVYTITDTLADAADIRSVVFNDNLDVRDRDGLRAWQINFTLKEYKSVPETAEQRATANVSPSAGTAPGQNVSAPQQNQTASQGKEQEAIQQRGFIYESLKSLDKFLAPDTEQ